MELSINKMSPILNCRISIDQIFAATFAEELGFIRHLEDLKGNTHARTYNMNLNNLRLIEDWMSLRVFYNLQDDHDIPFRYVGNYSL